MKSDIPQSDRTPLLPSTSRLPAASSRLLLLLSGVLITILILILHFVALDADAYPRLSWSSALLTDEGFYIHNARNISLFGRFRTDEWNNALIMPTLHFVQTAVFKLFGVGTIQARMITVGFSLLLLLLFWRLIRRSLGAVPAICAVALLGLDHISLLYHRLALMDTPSTLPMVASLYAFLRFQERKSDSPEIPALLWLSCSGAFLAAAYTIRGFSLLLLPIPIFLLYIERDKRNRKEWLRSLAAFVIGFGLVMGCYAIFWWLPHHAELSRLNRYYMHEQLMPRSLFVLFQNFGQAIAGNSRYLLPSLARHSPVQLMLSMLAMTGILARWRRLQVRKGDELLRFAALWQALFLLVFTLISYSPSRYYVLFYPAMAILSAYALTNWNELLLILRDCRPWALLIAGLAGYNIGAALPLPGMVLPICVGIVTAVLIVSALNALLSDRQLPDRISALRFVPVLLGAAWFAVNLYWTADWLTHLTYRQKQADRWLAQNLPPDSVLLGATAMGLTINNRFQSVNVMERFCNDDHPVERFGPNPRYVIILDAGWKERWWMRNYPSIVKPSNRIHQFDRMLRPFFTLGVYPVPVNFSAGRTAAPRLQPEEPPREDESE